MRYVLERQVRDLPSGTLTFLFTDIEGSTKLWEAQPDAMQIALERHDVVMRNAIETNGGTVFKTMGDAFCAAFATAPEALEAALAAQQGLAPDRSRAWAAPSSRFAWRCTPERPSGETTTTSGSRSIVLPGLLCVGHGGQVLLSQATQELVRDDLPVGVTLRDMGERRLQDLIRPERVYQMVAAELPAEFPPLKTLDARAHNLPIQSTSFVGRDREMQEVKTLLRSSRLVTLTGSGGAGKTRLALQVGADRIDDFADSVWLVELAPLTDERLIAQTVLTVLGIKEQPAVTIADTLIKELKNKELLLLLDNCEHLVEASARICQTLLTACPRVRILATSREALRIAGEATYRVPSLATPDPTVPSSVASLTQFDAVRLFIDRALAVQPAFRVNNANAPALASICHHLDGIPLAIELAAARVRSMSVEEVNARLDQRFRLLTGGSRSALPRQQTLRSTIDWSYDLLSPGEQALFCRLAVFVGGWTFVAADHVCSGRGLDEASVLDLLTSLADKSLVLAEERSGATRYRMLETVRQYARGRLRERDEETHWQDRHLAYFVAWAEEAAANNDAAEQRLLLEQLEAEHDNVRSALAWSAEPGGDGASGLRLAHVFDWLWKVRGHFQEGRGWLSKLLAATPGGPTAARAAAFRDAGHMALLLGEHAAARTLLEEALALWRELGDQRGIAATLSRLGEVARRQGDFVTARAQLDAALAIQRELGDRPTASYALAALGALAADHGDYAAARTLLEEALAAWREVGAQKGIAMRLHDLGLVATEQGDYAAARAMFDECLPIFRELGDRTGIAATLAGMGIGALKRGDNGVAAALLKEGLAIFRELSYRDGIADSLERLAEVAMAVSEPGPAARMWGAAERLREEMGGPLPPSARVRYDRHVAAARAAMGDDAAFHRAWQEGRMMTLEQAVEYAMAKRDV